MIFIKFDKNKLIKSPFNYIGGKYKLLPQILPLFPDNIYTFYDIFGGGGNVSLNVDSKYVYYNDIVHYISNMFKEVKGKDPNNCLIKIKNIINKYKLSKTNKDGFLKLRNDYNNGKKSWEYFYVLTCYSFNYQFRFNNKHEYNSSFGKNRSHFSKQMENRFIKFIHRINSIDIIFDNKDFRNINLSYANQNDLVYCDPPYLITTGNYNDGKRGFKGWRKQDELDLLNLLDELNNRKIKFALSNVLKHKGKSNEILKKWSKKYNVHYLNKNYNNCNYQSKNKNGSIEVLITNYS